MPTLPRTESLKSRSAIERLFGGESHSTSVWPLRAVWQVEAKPQEDGADIPPARLMVSVGKRHFHHAVDRNRAKRQVREQYRIAKAPLASQLQAAGQSLTLAFIWLSDTHVPSPQIAEAVRRLLVKIAEKCRKTGQPATQQ